MGMRRGPFGRLGAGRALLLAMAVLGGLVGPVSTSTPAGGEASSAVVDFADPFVVPVPGGYVAYATPPSGHAGVAMARSSDLQSWESVTATGATGVDDRGGPGTGLWAPAVVERGGVWRLYVSAPSVGGSGRCITTTVIPGPDTVSVTAAAIPVVCGVEGSDAIDPEVFVDADGTAWLLWKSILGPAAGEARSGHSALWSQPLDALGTSVTGAPSVLLSQELAWEQPVVEAPSMVRWQGGYVLFYSGGTFVDHRYATGLAVCSSPAGPCARVGALPALASRPDLVGPGGGSAFVDHRGRLRLAFHRWSTVATLGGPRGVRTLEVAHVVGTLPWLRVVTAPFGALDVVKTARTTVRLRGWAIDPDGPGSTVVSVEVDGVPAARVRTAGSRSDVAAAYPGYGTMHGFEVTVPLPPGRHVVCARFSDAAAECRAVRTSSAPRSGSR